MFKRRLVKHTIYRDQFAFFKRQKKNKNSQKSVTVSELTEGNIFHASSPVTQLHGSRQSNRVYMSCTHISQIFIRCLGHRINRPYPTLQNRVTLRSRRRKYPRLLTIIYILCVHTNRTGTMGIWLPASFYHENNISY